LSGTADPVATDIPRNTGMATGRLHAALSGLHRPGFETRAATREDLAGWLGTAEATFRAAVQAVAAVDAGLAARIEAASQAVRAALRPLGDRSIPIRLQRIHGDLHVGQVLPGPDDVLLVDFEGDPTRDPRDRRALAPPLRDVAAFLRSIDHVARSGFRRAGALGNQPLGSGPLGPGPSVALDAWIEAARAAFLEGYALGLGDTAWALDRDLLRAFEVEKELGEFVYAATFLPEWLYAPTGGLGALLGSPFQPVRAE
ncbi:MAG: aminoglycoside phosphotransferase, partial [Chloroflexi bacterium]|nr:aminoglycoside phosphotransferase [Chloroflexota bacterium]